MDSMKQDPMIVALDVESTAEALRLVEQIGDAATIYKIGLELVGANGLETVRAVLAEGKQVFLDLKLHDISETVKRAMGRISDLGVHFVTVHATAQVMEAAMAGKRNPGMTVLGVTVLTSLAVEDLRRDGVNPALELADVVELRVRNGMAAGIDGFVCSPLEVGRVRGLTGPGKILVTPGVRSAGVSAGDQKRVATPADALWEGADFFVMGRQITRAGDPQAEAERVKMEIRQASGWGEMPAASR